MWHTNFEIYTYACIDTGLGLSVEPGERSSSSSSSSGPKAPALKRERKTDEETKKILDSLLRDDVSDNVPDCP